MKFKFNVNLSDADYFEYNKFWMKKSHYGKKQMLQLRLMVALFIGIYVSGTMLARDFSLGRVIAVLILFVIFEVLLSPLYFLLLKFHLKSLKKKGKMAYSPSSVIEFYDDCFIELTPDNKTEQKYSAIERISLVDGKMVYIHINNIMSYLLPFSAFESGAQFDDFIEFIGTKCSVIDRY